MAYSRPGVYINETLLPAPQLVTGTANAAGACIGRFAAGTEDVTHVTSWYDFVKKFGGYSSSYPATFGVGLYFQNGGSELYVRRVLASDAAAASSPIAPASGTDDVGTVTAKSKGVDGNFLRFEFKNTSRSGYYNFIIYKESAASYTDSSDDNDRVVESYSNVVLDDALSSDYIVTVVNYYSQLVTVAINTGVALIPAVTRIPLQGGSDSDTDALPTASDYAAVLDDFTKIDRPLVLFAPEVNSQLGGTDGNTIADAMADWAQSNNGFVVLDTPAALDVNGTPVETVDAAITYANGVNPQTSFAAAYYPNIYISDPVGRSPQSLRKVGPAGAIAGLYIQTDKQQGPFKAPAGLRATIRGAVALEKSFTTSELDQLNTGTLANGTVLTPVNALRNIPGAGIVAMGARTLLQDGTANRYVNTRRSLIYLRKSLKDLSEFALFENNDERLWSKLRTTLNVFLNGYWNQGGLRGVNASQAFYVKCDMENNPDASIMQGEVHIEIGVALQYPAEFVVINLSQKTSAA
jgi:phage tail sheath protein FI